jgi:hypothetical protein
VTKNEKPHMTDASAIHAAFQNAPVVYDFDRDESDMCEALTPGCPVNHSKSPRNAGCETW